MATSQPPSSHGSDGHPQADSLDSILLIIDGPGDTTIRPRRPNIPLDYPRPLLPRTSPPAEPPKSDENRE